MTSDGGSEFKSVDIPESGDVKVSGSSNVTREKGMSVFLRRAIDKAKKSLRRGTPALGSSESFDLFSKEAKRKVIAAAPEGYRWVANEPKLEDFELEEVASQNQYLESLRENNDVYLGDAFDNHGRPLSEYRGVYTKPKTESKK